MCRIGDVTCIYFILYFSLSLSVSPRWPAKVLMEVAGNAAFFMRGMGKRISNGFNISPVLLFILFFCSFVLAVIEKNVNGGVAVRSRVGKPQYQRH